MINCVSAGGNTAQEYYFYGFQNKRSAKNVAENLAQVDVEVLCHDLGDTVKGKPFNGENNAEKDRDDCQLRHDSVPTWRVSAV